MYSEGKHNEEELNLIILEHLDECKDYTNVCELKQTETGKERIVTRIKELIFEDGYKDIDAAIAKVEDEIAWTKIAE